MVFAAEGRSPHLNADDYARMAEAIEFLRQNYRSQPDLATVAQRVHLSEYHFQRLFSRWAGISPKRFLQYLTVESAKARIEQTRTLLDLSLESGFSSSARLHDLFVTLEAMSPGEYRAQGKGLAIAYGVHDTALGRALIAQTPRGVCAVQFVETGEEGAAIAALQTQWGQADLSHDPQVTQGVGDRLCQSWQPGATPPLPLLVRGTNFQIQVWRALLRLPLGGLTTYQDLALGIGRPTAARAVGNAIGANPVAYFIPCHRVIRATGSLGGYRWGLPRKSMLLGWEASQVDKIDETERHC